VLRYIHETTLQLGAVTGLPRPLAAPTARKKPPRYPHYMIRKKLFPSLESPPVLWFSWSALDLLSFDSALLTNPPRYTNRGRRSESLFVVELRL